MRKYYRTDNRQAFYAERIESQEGRCAICKNKARLVIDHDRASGLMRGLLCYKHNTALGLFGDNPELLIAAANYLRTTTPEPVVTRSDSSKLGESAIFSLINDLSFPSDRARARFLAEKTGCLYSTAQTRVRRARKKLLTTGTTCAKLSDH